VTGQLPGAIKDMEVGIEQIVIDCLKEEAELKAMKKMVLRR
jgi:hypothetical protein